MNRWIWITGLVAGVLHAEVLFDTKGFEAPQYLCGSVVIQNQKGMNWVEWDPVDGNNAHYDYTMIQSDVAHNGAQALALADINGRVIARANGLKMGQDVIYVDGWYKTESRNDPGLVRITLRYKTATGVESKKLFSLNTTGGHARLFDNADISCGASANWGEWIRITIQVKLKENAYAVYVNGAPGFSGTLEKNGVPVQLDSWELDATITDSKRNPKGKYAAYVDDLIIQTSNPLQ